MSSLVVVDDLSRKMGALALENGTHPASHAPPPAQNGLVDFAYLQGHEIVDATGKLATGHTSCFQSKLTPEAEARGSQFLNKPRTLAGKNVTLHELLFTHLAGVGCNPAFVGEEISHIVGPTQFISGLTALTNVKAVSKDLRSNLAQRLNNFPETLTIRFTLNETMPKEKRHLLAESYQQNIVARFGSNSASRCYGQDHLSNFCMELNSNEGNLRLNIVFFATKLQSNFVATLDAVQLVIPQNGDKPYLLDDGNGDQWVIDTALQLLRIPQGGDNLSKLLFRYLLEGNRVTGSELDIFKSEYLKEPNAINLLALYSQLTKAPRCSQDQALFAVYLIATITDRMGHSAIASSFITEALKVQGARFAPRESMLQKGLELVVQNKISAKELEACFFVFGKVRFTLQYDFQSSERSGCSTLIGFLGHLLIYRQTKSSATKELLVSSFYPRASSLPAVLQSQFLVAMNEVLDPERLPAALHDSEIEWIESLMKMQSADLQRIGYDLLYRQKEHVDVKKKWIRALLSEPSGQALRFIMQLQGVATVDEMTSWMQGSTRRSYLFYQLLAADEKKWLPVCIKVDPQEILSYYQQVKKSDKAKAQRAFVALFNQTDTTKLSQAFLSALAEVLRDGVTVAPVPQVLASLAHHAPERESVWSEDLVMCLRSCLPQLSDPERENLVKTHFAFVIHPQVAKESIVFFARSLKYLVDSQYELKAQQKTHFRVMCKEIVRVVAPVQLTSATRLIDLHLASCGHLQDEETMRILLSAYETAVTLTKEQIEWYINNRAVISPRVVPLSQLRLILSFCERAPSAVTSALAATVAQLQARAQNLPEFPGFASEVGAVRVKALAKVSCFDEVFGALLPKKKTATATVTTKRPAANHVELKKLFREGNLQELIQKLLLCKADDQEAKKMVPALVQELVKRKPIDPQRTIFSLFEHFQIVEFEPWKQLILSLAEQLEFESLTVGVGILAKFRTTPMSLEHKALWFAIMANPYWFCHKNFFELLNEKDFFKGVVQDVRGDEWLKFWGDFTFLLVRSLLKAFANSPERNQFLPVMHMWVDEILHDGAKFEMVCELLKIANPKGSYDDFQRVAKLLKTFAALAQQHVLPEAHQKKQSNERFRLPIEGFLRAAKTRLDETRAVDEACQVVQVLGKAAVLPIDTLLVVELEHYPCERVREALSATLGRLVKNASSREKSYQDKLIASIDRIATLGSTQALSDLYGHFFCNAKMMPSEFPVSTLIQTGSEKIHNETSLLGGFATRVYEVLARGYPRFLANALSSPNPLHTRCALNVEIALSMQGSTGMQAFMRRAVPRVKQLQFELYVKHVEEYGWTEETVRFQTNFHYLNLHPARLSPDNNPDGVNLLKVIEENCEMIFSLIDHERFYFAAYNRLHPPQTPALVPDIISYGRPIVRKTISAFLPSEKKYYEITCRFINVAFDRLSRPNLSLLVRSRLLDHIVAHLRVLIELYPQTSLANFLLKFSSACAVDDPLFETHRRVVFGLMRLAMYKKVISRDTHELGKWIGQFGKSVEDLSSKSDGILLRIEAEILRARRAPEEFQPHRLIEWNMQMRSWIDEHLVDNFEVLGRTMKQLFTLWTEHPEMISASSILRTMDCLVVPNSVFIGLDRGEEGQKFAFNLMTRYLEALHVIYAKSPAPQAPMLIQLLNGLFLPQFNPQDIACKRACEALIYTLKRAQLFGVYEGHFEAYKEQVQKLIPLLTQDVKVPVPQIEDLVVQFVHVCTVRHADSNTDSGRVDLVNEWVKALLVAIPKLGMVIVKKAIYQLFSSRFIMEVPYEKKEIVLFWLTIIDGYDAAEKREWQNELLHQLSFFKFRIQDPNERLEFNRKLPKFLQVEI